MTDVTIDLYGELGETHVENPGPFSSGRVSAMDFESVFVDFDEDQRKPKYTCRLCGDPIMDLEDLDDEDNVCMSPLSADDKHVAMPAPLSWANSARITADDDSDAIHVAISVGDPRGAFVMTVRRDRYVEDDGTVVDELRLSLPHESDGEPHAGGVTPINGRGFYRVNGG